MEDVNTRRQQVEALDLRNTQQPGEEPGHPMQTAAKTLKKSCGNSSRNIYTLTHLSNQQDQHPACVVMLLLLTDLTLIKVFTWLHGLTV